MRLETEALTKVTTATVALVRDRIVEIVTENGGVKETDLAIIVISALSEDPIGLWISPEKILNLIQCLVNEGRIIAVDCLMGDTGCTFLLPAGTQIRTVVPIDDRRTRH